MRVPILLDFKSSKPIFSPIKFKTQKVKLNKEPTPINSYECPSSTRPQD